MCESIEPSFFKAVRQDLGWKAWVQGTMTCKVIVYAGLVNYAQKMSCLCAYKKQTVTLTIIVTRIAPQFAVLCWSGSSNSISATRLLSGATEQKHLSFQPTWKEMPWQHGWSWFRRSKLTIGLWRKGAQKNDACCNARWISPAETVSQWSAASLLHDLKKLLDWATSNIDAIPRGQLLPHQFLAGLVSRQLQTSGETKELEKTMQCVAIDGVRRLGASRSGHNWEPSI